MKITSFFLIALLLTSITEAQDYESGHLMDLDMYQNSSVDIGNKSYSDNVIGTPYQLEEFTLGTLVMVGQPSQKVFLRYDIYSDVIEIAQDKSGDNKNYALKDERISIELDNKTFRFLRYNQNGYDKSGYVQILSEIDGNLLVLRRDKKILQPEASGASGYAEKKNPKFSDSEEFLLRTKDGNVVELSNHKKRILRKLESDKAESVKSYIKKNKIKFDDNYVGLVKVIKYFLTL